MFDLKSCTQFKVRRPDLGHTEDCWQVRVRIWTLQAWGQARGSRWSPHRAHPALALMPGALPSQWAEDAPASRGSVPPFLCALKQEVSKVNPGTSLPWRPCPSFFPLSASPHCPRACHYFVSVSLESIMDAAVYQSFHGVVSSESSIIRCSIKTQSHECSMVTEEVQWHFWWRGYKNLTLRTEDVSPPPDTGMPVVFQLLSTYDVLGTCTRHTDS